MKINNNMAAKRSLYSLNKAHYEKGDSLEKLSSGKKINDSSDNPDGYAINVKLKNQLKGIRMAKRNALDGISMMQTVDGALNEAQSMLQKMRSLAVKAGNSNLTAGDRNNIQKEFDGLRDEIARMSDVSEFNKIKLLDGNAKFKLHIGANKNQDVDIELGSLELDDLGIDLINLSDITESNNSIEALDNAINYVSEERSKVGAYHNRLENSIKTLDNSKITFTKAISKLEDIDMALEMVEFTKQDILVKAGTAMLAQANDRPESLLRILN